jgi:hypothetical protein
MSSQKPKRKFILSLPRIIFDFIQLACIGLYDLLLHVKVKLYKENPIGVYVGICKAVEKRWFFSESIAGGYCGLATIKLFYMNVSDGMENSVSDILNHEVLHQVIGKVTDAGTRAKLDKVHKSFWIVDEDKIQRITMSFVVVKDGKLELIS